jgi:lysophospholipid acyltransferase (LPLAT)-like uncharacterized protein
VQLTKDIAKSGFTKSLVALLVIAYIRLVRWTSRATYVNDGPIRTKLDSGRPVIALAWHGRLLMLPFTWIFGRPLHCLVSRHGDGEYLARIIERLGFLTVRGSSERTDKARRRGGAAATRQLLRVLKDGHCVAITPDGPRGPRMRMSDGVVMLARLTGVPVIPVAYSNSRRRLLSTWDRFHVALPFSRFIVIYGDPIEVPRDLDEAGAETWRLRIEDALNRLTAEADRMAGQAPVEPAPAPANAQEEAA